MSLLSKLFKKPQSAAYEPQNHLEELLKEAGNDPAKRQTFLNQLFHFKLYVLGRLDGSEDPLKGQAIQIAHFSAPDSSKCAYVFTSLLALEKCLAIHKGSEQSYLALPALTLFETLQGSLGIVINPGLPFGVYFTADQLTEILAGKTNKPVEKKLVENTEILFGQPSAIPEDLLKDVSNRMKKFSQISDVYFGMSFVKEPSYFFAVDFSLDLEKHKKGQILHEFLQFVPSKDPDYPVDFMIADEKLRELAEKGTLISLKKWHFRQ